MMKMKLKSRAIGISNEVSENERVLFIDIDNTDIFQLDIQNAIHRLLQDYKHLLLLKTKHGYHVITFTPLSLREWKHQLLLYSDIVDDLFVELSLKHEYSVLRISAKYSVKNNSPISPRPKFYSFTEKSAYNVSLAHFLLYKAIYNFKHSEKLTAYKNTTLKLHFYKTGGE
jgi:hypothetical protein